MWSRCFPPVEAQVGGGDSMELYKKTTFQGKFGGECSTLKSKDNHFQAKKKNKKRPFSNKRCFSSSHFNFGKKLKEKKKNKNKKPFPKEFFNEFWVIVKHKYIYIYWKKIWSFQFLYDFRGKTFFPSPPQKLC